MEPIKTDAELCQHYPTLEPEWTHSRILAEKVMVQFEADYFKPIIKKLTDQVTEHLWDLFRDYLISDTEQNIAGHVRDRIERSVQALLSGEEWVIKKYVLADHWDSLAIRNALVKQIPKELQDQRVLDLEKELKTVKENLQREKDWNNR